MQKQEYILANPFSSTKLGLAKTNHSFDERIKKAGEPVLVELNGFAKMPV